MQKADKFTLEEVEFCKLFNESIRSRIIIRLLNYEELRISDFNLDDCRLKRYTDDNISRSTITNHLSKLKNDGFISFRKEGLYAYWRIDKGNFLINQFRRVFSDLKIENKKRWSNHTPLEIKNYLSEFYHIHDVFKPSEFRTRLEQKSYFISSARLSQILRGFTQSGYLKKEEKARYKIKKMFTEEEFL